MAETCDRGMSVSLVSCRRWRDPSLLFRRRRQMLTPTERPPILHRWKWRSPLLGVQTLAPVRELGSPRVILDTGLFLEQGRVYPQPVPLP